MEVVTLWEPERVHYAFNQFCKEKETYSGYIIYLRNCAWETIFLEEPPNKKQKGSGRCLTISFICLSIFLWMSFKDSPILKVTIRAHHFTLIFSTPPLLSFINCTKPKNLRTKLCQMEQKVKNKGWRA